MDLSLLEHFRTIWPLLLATDFLRYAIAASVLVIVLALGQRWLVKRRLQKRKPGRHDVSREIRYSLATVLIFSLNGYAIVLGEAFGVFAVYGGPMPPLVTLAIDFALIVVAHDAYFYWMHRAIHHRRLFRHVHRVHHLSRTPTPWAAYAFAPSEAVLEAIFLPLFLVFAETHALVVFAFTTHMIVRNVIGHAGTELFPAGWLDWPLLRWITTTTHHDMHHQHVQGNYGLYFRFWDRLMGTEFPDYEQRFRRAVGQPQAAASATKRSVRPLLVALLMASVLWTETRAAPAGSSSVDGFWVTGGFDAIAVVAGDTSASGSLNATVVWVWDDDAQHIVGTALFERMVFDGAVWRDGRVLDPASGRQYRAVVTPLSPDRLHLKGCVGPFCREQVWRRWDSVRQSLPTGVIECINPVRLGRHVSSELLVPF
ncbi:MAG: sterol desaturase family protein [Pseudomonadota bacterium]